MRQAGNFTVTASVPAKVFDYPQDDAYMLTNTGSQIIYLDVTPNASATRGTPLNPGASKEWPAGTPCYVICATGSSVLNVGPVGTVYDPAAVGNSTATSLIASGFATDVGDATSAALNASGFAAAVGTETAANLYLTGVPIVDKPAILFAGNVSLSTPTMDFNVSQYQSFVFGSRRSLLLPAAALEGALYRITWYTDDPNGSGVQVGDNVYLGNNYDHRITYKDACRSAWMRVEVLIMSPQGPGFTDGVAELVITASLRQTEPEYFNSNLCGLNSGPDYYDERMQLYMFASTAGTTVTFNTSFYSGPGTFSLYCTGTGAFASGNIDIRLVHTDSSGTTRRIHTLAATARGVEEIDTIYLPKGNITIDVQNTTAILVNVRIALTTGIGK